MYLPQGTELNHRYVIESVLGHGGFGITYAARDKILNVRVAIKEYLPRQLATRGEGQTKVSIFTGEARQQYDYGLRKFLEEAQSVARFSHHPNIVSARDYFEAHGTAYMVMEYVEGVTLKEYLAKKGGRISFEEATGILMPVMDALREVHQGGMLHRDISPDNIYITTTAQVKILDFGAARYFAGEQSKSLSVILKSGYAPEEQYRSSGKQGSWTDVYAVGATLYKALTGQTPPDALDRMAEDTLVPPSRLGVNIPPQAEQALLTSLAVNAGSRFPDMGAFQQALLGNFTVPQGAQHPSAPLQPAPGYSQTTVVPPVAAPGPPPGYVPPAAAPAPYPYLPRRSVNPAAIAAGIGGGVLGLVLAGVLIWKLLDRPPQLSSLKPPEPVTQEQATPPPAASPGKAGGSTSAGKESPQGLLPGMIATPKPQQPSIPPRVSSDADLPEKIEGKIASREPSAPRVPPAAPDPLARFQAGKQWQLDWQSKFTYRGVMKIRQQLEPNRYLTRITVTYVNTKNKVMTVSMDGLLTIQVNDVVINCSNASESWWDTDDFYLKWHNDTMTGYNEDKRGRRGHAVFRFVEIPLVGMNVISNKKGDFLKYAGLGDEYRLKGDYGKAIFYYDQAINLIPDYGDFIYNNRGLTYLKMGNYQRAIEDFNHALKLNPSDGLIYNNRGVAYHGINDFQRAYADLIRAQNLGHKINYAFFKKVAAAAGKIP